MPWHPQDNDMQIPPLSNAACAVSIPRDLAKTKETKQEQNKKMMSQLTRVMSR